MTVRTGRPLILTAFLLLVAGSAVVAQESALIEVLAPALAAEDARDWRPEAFQSALASPDSMVRSTGAMAIGRVGDPRGVPLLVPLLIDPDTTVRVSAVFALGLIGDSSAVGPLVDRLTGAPVLDAASAAEAMTALARIGGRRAADFLAAVLGGRAPIAIADTMAVLHAAAIEAWRLGALAPVAELLPLTGHTDDDLRWQAVYSLSRLRAREAAPRLSVSLRDELFLARAFAVRAFNPAFADSAGLTLDAAAAQVAPLIDDPDPGVRINALRALASLGVTAFARQVVPRLDDAVPNVRVEAAATLGALGGPDAVAALRAQLGRRVLFAVRREALLGLAAADTAALRAELPSWSGSADWVDRMVAARASAALGGRPPLLDDPDSRVVAAALSGWAEEAEAVNPLLAAEARRRLGHRDAAVRSVAADVLARAPDPADIKALGEAHARAARDSFPDAGLSALAALAAIAATAPAAAQRVAREFLDVTPVPTDSRTRRWAEERWPDAARRWGPAHPLRTGRTLQDYREIARRFLVAPDSIRRPHLFIETEQRGTIEIELLGPEAPLTVTNFLGLVDRRFFDGNRWHRVVPNFVIQDGDPRGDGWGGSNTPVRDEINRVRYRGPVVGMALSGPDTGTSQWFITFGAQPHLDGQYTVFGRVIGSMIALSRVTQGDVIRTIRR